MNLGGSAVPLPLVSGLLFAASAGLWYAYFRMKERGQGAPFPRVAAVLGGGLASLASLFFYSQLERLGFTLEWSALEEGGVRALASALAIGAIEEFAKVLPVIVVALVFGSVRRSRDAVILACCAGVGFSAAENAYLVQRGLPLLMEGLARAVAAPITHAVFAAPVGFGLALYWLHGRKLAPLLGLAASTCAHGAYNFLLAQPGLPRMAAPGVVLLLWGWVLFRTTPRVTIARSFAKLRALTLPQARPAPTVVRPRTLTNP